MLISMSNRYHSRAPRRQNGPGYALTLHRVAADVARGAEDGDTLASLEPGLTE